MGEGVHKPQHKQRRPRTTSKSRFSPSAFLWVAGIELKVLVFVASAFTHQTISLALSLNSDDNGLDTKWQTGPSILVTRYMALTESVLSRDSFVNSSQASWQLLPQVPSVDLQSSVTQPTLRRKEGLLVSTQPPSVQSPTAGARPCLSHTKGSWQMKGAKLTGWAQAKAKASHLGILLKTHECTFDRSSDQGSRDRVQKSSWRGRNLLFWF